jgi:limonene-1,2-epoxide hydrolase
MTALRGAMNAEQVVRAELAAWDHLDVDEAMKYFAQDAIYDIGPSYPRLSGHDAIRKTLHAYFNRATECDLKILHLAVDGHVVLMERCDHWIVNGKPMDTPVMGTYEVKNQKITAWIDTPVMGTYGVKNQKITAWRKYLIPPENP